MRLSLTIALTAALSLPVTGFAAGDVDAGKAKSAGCAGCHGADGNSPAPAFPNLAGQNTHYIEKQLIAFRDGSRKNATMNGMSAALSDTDIANLAAYYHVQKPKRLQAEGDLVDAGQRIYLGGLPDKGVTACIACHGPRGMGNEQASYPVIRGQYAAYIETALKDFKAGERSVYPVPMMQNIASRMSDADIKAVSQYAQGLH